jgi:hypothetical protein
MADPKDILRLVRVAVDASAQIEGEDDDNSFVTKCCEVLQVLERTEVTAQVRQFILLVV